MTRKIPIQPAGFRSDAGDLIARLRRTPLIGDHSPSSAALVMAIRLMACSLSVGRDPVVEISQHIGSLTAAKAVLDFAKVAADFWPEKATVARPCCHALTPDESVFAQMIEAAGRADRQAFSAVLSGLVRSDRHDTLYEASRQAFAAIAVEA